MSAPYSITRQPFTGSASGVDLLSRKAVSGVLDGTGNALVTLPMSPVDTLYLLTIFGHGEWTFVVGAADANVVSLLTDQPQAAEFSRDNILQGANIILSHEGAIDVRIASRASPTAPGFYTTSIVDYSDADARISLSIDEFEGYPGVGAFYALALFPPIIQRGYVDVSMRVNTFADRSLSDRNTRAVVASQLTPGRLHSLLYLPGTIGQFLFVDPLGVRPQDYSVYAAWKSAVGFTGFVEADFVLNRGGVSETGVIDIDLVPHTVFHTALWVPADTGDISTIFEAGSYGELLQFYEDGGALTVNGVVGKVLFEASDNRARVNPLSFTITQEYP